VHVGVTSTLELAWWIRERIAALGLEAWFQPTVSLQRRGAKLGDIGLTPDEVIRPGDLLHCDVGIRYLGLATDTQQHAYALRLGESAPPAGLARALAIGNRLQDIVAGEFAAGLSGNEVLRRARQRAAAEGIVGRIYSHPIGYHGHGAGPLIGLYDNQESVPGRGDYPLHDDTLYALELYVESQVPEWEDQQVKIALEQTVAFTGGQVHYLAGRQTALHVI
jgi:Xaa-Pro aminopeptidase